MFQIPWTLSQFFQFNQTNGGEIQPQQEIQFTFFWVNYLGFYSWETESIDPLSKILLFNKQFLLLWHYVTSLNLNLFDK